MSLELTKQIVDLQRQVDSLIKPEVPFGMSLISEMILSASAASVTFSSIPQGFRHLMLICHARSDQVAELDTLILRLNGDGGANYDYQQEQNGGFAVSRAATFIVAGFTEAANSRAANFSSSQMYIFHYSQGGTEKYAYSYGGCFGDLSADADLNFISSYGHWRDTSIVTSVSLLLTPGPNFVSSSRVQLYGIM